MQVSANHNIKSSYVLSSEHVMVKNNSYYHSNFHSDVSNCSFENSANKSFKNVQCKIEDSADKAKGDVKYYSGNAYYNSIDSASLKILLSKLQRNM